MTNEEYLSEVRLVLRGQVDPRLLGEYTIRVVECYPLVPSYRVQVSLLAFDRVPVVVDTAKSKYPRVAAEALATWLSTKLPVMT